eukprot:TRINITY_DN4839_c0_g1_i1.p1 TRINITY_DN4839_c0_g1~~TRINITY_DN4839_c0_g1_i1.p1  ORF type:complete len:470 (-),score=109.70 TRINITY_DN4839_c0_g1_i1:77-1486(-)
MASQEFTDISTAQDPSKIQRTVTVSKKGIVYDNIPANGSDEEAANEHAREKLSLFISMEEIQRRFGIGTRLYFNFLKFMCITDLILGLVAIIPFIISVVRRNDGRFTAEDLFISSFTSEDYVPWLVVNIILIVIWFSFSPIYWIYIKSVLARDAIPDHDNLFALSGEEVDVIQENKHFTSSQRFLRRFGTYAIFVILICISGGVTYGIQRAGNPYAAKVLNPINWVITASVTIVNLFFQKFCVVLVNMEKHKTWSQFRKHHTIKLLSFKIINVCAMYVALNFAFASDETACIFKSSGSKFVTLMILDVTLMNFIELATPVVNRMLFTYIPFLKNKRMRGDEEMRPDFDVAEDYLELFYRQFVVYLGVSVFPFLPFFGLFNNIVEYWIDKVRLLRICKKPKPIDLTLKRWLVIWLGIVGVAALVSWPQGAAWILSSRNRDVIENKSFACCRLLNEEGFFVNGTNVCKWSF